MTDIDELLQAHSRRVNEGDGPPPNLSAMLSESVSVHRSWSRGMAIAAAVVIVLGAAGIGLGAAAIRSNRTGHHGSTVAAHPLVGTQWQLVRIIPASGAAIAVPVGNAYLFLDGKGKLFADDSCNILGASAKIEPDQLLLTDSGTTLVGCGPSPQRMFLRYVSNSRVEYQLDANGLKVSSGGVTLLFTANQFAGSSWHITAVRSANGSPVKLGSAAPVLTFSTFQDAGIRVSGNNGCRPLDGSVSVLASQFRFGALGGTSTGCALPALADAIDSMLSGGTASYQVSGDTLTISRAGAATVVAHRSR